MDDMTTTIDGKTLKRDMTSTRKVTDSSLFEEFCFAFSLCDLAHHASAKANEMWHGISHCHVDRPSKLVHFIWIHTQSVCSHELGRDGRMECFRERVAKKLEWELTL